MSGIFVSIALLNAQTSSSVDLTELKQMEVERLRGMAEAGAIPRARLEQAQAELADAQDNMVLRRSLYGTVRVEDFTKDQAAEMVLAAQRLVERHQDRYERSKELVDEGVLARASLSVMLEDLEFRRKALDLAQFRAKLVDELAEYAHAEEAADSDEGVTFRLGRIVEKFNGSGMFTEVDWARISNAYSKQFARPLPVSAKGETATHRALGFDHRGRIDIALNPDQREGVWLRGYLKKLNLPYFAFRAAVRGSATAPHIHLGPPSQRLRVAD
ncbi:MAG: hypothetical protein SGI92_22760 [Bryobacteraceae bacterium]|nr:hypothetical protein [Bryobacteraceae bacterium]